ncbi:MAG: glycosyltransferase family 92 protein [Desulfovibrio sp.]|jgi:hypothetical protein|nr:glycosyltransferase family 92 protein [Desulfovibrio sp.]
MRIKYCAICCIAKDEDPFLREWLTYHSLIGFEHFIIYDNQSALPISRFLRGFADKSRVTVIRNLTPLSQPLAYTHCLERFGRDFKWIAFLDLDEFIRLKPFVRGGDGVCDIRIFLTEFEPYAGVGLNWRVFSSSGHETRPEGPVIAAYTRSLGDDIHIKSIVQPARVLRCADPHSFSPKPGEFIVNPDHFPIPPAFGFAVPETDKACVHHYFYKSRECFAQKIAKGNPCDIVRRMEEFDRHLSLGSVEDSSLSVFADEVRRRMEGKTLAQAPRLEYFPGCPDDAFALPPAWLKRNRGCEGARQAFLHLCHLTLCNEADQAPDSAIGMEIWSKRAETARLCEKHKLARFCLAQAMKLCAGVNPYLELAGQLNARKLTRKAANALQIFKSTKGRK